MPRPRKTVNNMMDGIVSERSSKTPAHVRNVLATAGLCSPECARNAMNMYKVLRGAGHDASFYG